VSKKGAELLISFGEIAKLCADRPSRTIIDNEAWKMREWVALGKLLEALFAGQFKEAKIRSEGMTEPDAIEQDGSLAEFLRRRLKVQGLITFASSRRPPEWDNSFTSVDAQSCADAYIRPCLITKTVADKWLADHNIVARKRRAEEPERGASRGPGRPSKLNELLRAKVILSKLRPTQVKEWIGQKKPTKKLIATKMVEACNLAVAPKTIINRYHKQLKLLLDALQK
jgi:hypothetical protein